MADAQNGPDASLTRDLHVEATYRLTEALVASENRMRRRVELLSDVVFETDANTGWCSSTRPGAGSWAWTGPRSSVSR